jgi:hypothetical protein
MRMSIGNRPMNSLSKFLLLLARLKNEAGSIAIESAFMIPLLLFCGMGASELAMAYMDKNSLTDMAVSYSHIISKKGDEVTEKTLKDMIDKSDVNSSQPDFFQRGRVIITAVNVPLGATKPKKLWQRCSPKPPGKSFATKFTGTNITMPTSMVPLIEEHTHILVEVFYDSQPLTGFYLSNVDANGDRIMALADMKTDISLKGEFKAAPDNPDAVAAASSSCS